MKESKELIKIECCNCKEIFEIALTKEQQKGTREIFCPYCEKFCVVEFEEKSDVVEVYRGVNKIK